MTLDLPLVWAGLLSVAIFAYVVLDGFDLGVGILFPFLKRGRERDTAMNSVAPVWDGNETWLVLGGGGLFAAFPLAYAILMPALYAPIIAMLLGLIFRGVAFEFRWRDKAHEKWWDRGFAWGSAAAAFTQGVVLGAFVQGVAVEGRAYAGGWFDWLTPFSLLTGAALVAGYGLLGAGWLIWKTSDDLQARIYRLAWPFTLATFAALGAVSLWTPFLAPEIAERWFTPPGIAFLWPVPTVTAGLGLALLWALKTRREALPFPLTLALFLLGFAGLGVSLFPYVVPRAVTIWQAAAPDSSLGFLLVGAVVLLPIILGYTGYAYWVFRGKVDPEAGYH
jgi:cytochrome d ubiquinol oxidase subunit II